MKWIDQIVEGVIEICGTNDIYDILDEHKIMIQRLDSNNPILCGNDALYVRSHNEEEIIFICNDCASNYERFILCHEFGHAILHIGVQRANYNNSLFRWTKLEKEADYFAFRLLDINVDPLLFDGCSKEQISKSIGVKAECLDY